MVHNPVANMILGSGVCPLAALRGAGIPVGIGTDGAASNDSQNMLEAVKAAALLQKVARLDPRAVSAGDVLAMATLEGARALRLDGLIGSLEPGKRADVVRLRGDRPGLANVHDPRQQVVYCTSPATWPTSGSTASAGSPTAAWSTTTWPPWSGGLGPPAPGHQTRAPRGPGPQLGVLHTTGSSQPTTILMHKDPGLGPRAVVVDLQQDAVFSNTQQLEQD